MGYGNYFEMEKCHLVWEKGGVSSKKRRERKKKGTESMKGREKSRIENELKEETKIGQKPVERRTGSRGAGIAMGMKGNGIKCRYLHAGRRDSKIRISHKDRTKKGSGQIRDPELRTANIRGMEGEKELGADSDYKSKMGTPPGKTSSTTLGRKKGRYGGESHGRTKGGKGKTAGFHINGEITSHFDSLGRVQGD